MYMNMNIWIDWVYFKIVTTSESHPRAEDPVETQSLRLECLGGLNSATLVVSTGEGSDR